MALIPYISKLCCVPGCRILSVSRKAPPPTKTIFEGLGRLIPSSLSPPFHCAELVVGLTGPSGATQRSDDVVSFKFTLLISKDPGLRSNIRTFMSRLLIRSECSAFSAPVFVRFRVSFFAQGVFLRSAKLHRDQLSTL
jgi:hypothetical protein